MFLRYLGFNQETLDLISPWSVLEKESVNFPFLFTNDFETLFIDKSIKRSKSGIFVISPDKSRIKSAAYYFGTVYDMMCFYQRSNKAAVNGALLVVTGLFIQRDNIDYIKSTYPTIVKHFILVPDCIGQIKISSFITGFEIKILSIDEVLILSNEHKNKQYSRFSFSKFAKDFGIKSNIKSLNIKKYLL